MPKLIGNKKTFLVVGLGRFGRAVCERLVELGDSVIAVDKVRARIEEITDKVDVAAQMDATDEEALKKIGAKEVDGAIVAIGSNIEASILATTLLIGMEVPYVAARANSAIHARVLARMGAQKVFFPERDFGFKVAEQVSKPALSNFIELPGSDFLIGEIASREEMVDKTLAELEFRNRYNAVVLLIKRGTDKFVPRADTRLGREDKLIVAAYREDLDKLIE